MRKKKNYFDEQKMQIIWAKKIDGTATEKEEQFFASQVDKLINGVLNIQKFDRFEPRDELIQEAWVAILKNWHKFDPNYDPSKLKAKSKIPTLFNYYSLIAKQAMFFYTKRRQKHRNTGHIEFNEGEYHQQFDITREDLKKVFRNICENTPRLRKNSIRTRVLDVLPNYFDDYVELFKHDPHSCHRTFIRYLKTRFNEEHGVIPHGTAVVQIRHLFLNNREKFEELM
jgi:hypothetical protein